jgi:hypothetical protein
MRASILARAPAMLAVLAASAAQATSIKDFWQSRPIDSPRFNSGKSLGALEMCLGMEMSEQTGPPSVLHGEHEVILSAVLGLYQNVVGYGYRVTDRGTSREVMVGALKSGKSTEQASAIAQRCI